MDVVVRAEDTELLVGLALDEEEEVQVAAIRALPGYDPVRARPMLLDRASRAAARARRRPRGARRRGGQLGRGPGADRRTHRLRRPLSPARRSRPRNLGTPEMAPLLVSLLRATTKPALRAEARAGLRRMWVGRATRFGERDALLDRGLRREAALLLSHQAEPRLGPGPRAPRRRGPPGRRGSRGARRADVRGLPDDGRAQRRLLPVLGRGGAARRVRVVRRRPRATPSARARPRSLRGAGTAEAREFLVALLAEFDVGSAPRACTP